MSPKKVRFSPDTIDNEHKGSSVRIISTDIENDHIIYTVKFQHKGIWWTIHKRYNEFLEIHNELVAESIVAQSELPPFPQKRWLQIRRWVDRFNEDYSMKRTSQLEAYLRALFSMKILHSKSKVFRKFFEVKSKGGEYSRGRMQLSDSKSSTSGDDDTKTQEVIYKEILEADKCPVGGSDDIESDDVEEDPSYEGSCGKRIIENTLFLHDTGKDDDSSNSTDSKKIFSLLTYIPNPEMHTILLVAVIFLYALGTHFCRSDYFGK